MQIKLLKLEQKNINEMTNTVIGKTLIDDNYIKQDKYTFLFKALETYKNKTFEEDEFVSDIIKVTLNSDENTAKSQWFDGI